MKLHLEIIGLILIVLAIVHAVFPRYFDWKQDFKNISLINREMMYVHTFFLALVLLLMGILCLTSASELVQTDIGRKISLGFGMFWVVRLLTQFFGYSVKLWYGKTFETTVHIVFSILWSYFSAIFLFAYWR